MAHSHTSDEEDEGEEGTADEESGDEDEVGEMSVTGESRMLL